MRAEYIVKYCCYLPVILAVTFYFWHLLEPRFGYLKSLLIYGGCYAASFFVVFVCFGPYLDGNRLHWPATLLYTLFDLSCCLLIWKRITDSPWGRILLLQGALMVLLCIGATVASILTDFILDSAVSARLPRLVYTAMGEAMNMLVQGILIVLFTIGSGPFYSHRRVDASWTSFALGLSAEALSVWAILYYIQVFDPGRIHPFLIVLTLFISADVYLERAFRQTVRSQELVQELRMQEQMQKMQGRQYAEMDNQLQQMRRLRHDYANTLTTLAALIDAGDGEGAARLIREEASPLERPILYTGNAVIDAVLYAKYLEAEKRGIKLELHLLLPEPLGVKERDIMSIFANLLDNAIEYLSMLNESAERRIGISSAVQGALLKLTFENTYPLPEPPSLTAPVSAKGPGAEHGNGLAIVRGIAAAYHGTLTASVRDGMLQMKVLLSLMPEETE